MRGRQTAGRHIGPSDGKTVAPAGSRRRTSRALIAATCCGGLTLAALTPVWAQDSGGLQMRFGVQSSLRSDSNYNLSTPSSGRGTVFDTQLSFDLTSETRNSTLTFSAATTARAARLPAPAGSLSAIEDPSLRFGYTRTGARSSLTLNARYNRADLDFVDPLRDPILIEDPNAPGNLILTPSTGTRTALGYGLGYETGRDMPLGLSLRLDHSELDYDGTVGTTRYDTETDSASASLRLDLTPTTVATLTASGSDYTARDLAATQRETRSLSLGLSHDIGELMQLTASVGTSRIEILQFGGTTVREGTTFGLGATRALPTGQLGLSYSRSLDTNGSRDTLQLRHNRETPLMQIGLSLGLTRGTAGTTSVIADASVSRELLRGSMGLSLSRGVATNDALEDVLSTRLNANYNHEIDAVSSVDFGVSFARVEDGGAGATAESDRSTISVTYNRALTEDWQMSAGVEHRRYHRAAGTAQGNAVFVTLGRSFDIRP